MARFLLCPPHGKEERMTEQQRDQSQPVPARDTGDEPPRKMARLHPAHRRALLAIDAAFAAAMS